MNKNQQIWLASFICLISGICIGAGLTKEYYDMQQAEHIELIEEMLDRDAELKNKEKDIIFIPLKVKE
jgi:uncharacterized membrane-anchored protein YhcB (DUF1043 family)